MRVLHLDSGREMRGGQWQVLRLHQALTETGHESFLLARQDGPLLTITAERGLPCGAFHPIKLRTQAAGYDLIHAHDARTHTVAAVVSTVPLVVSRRVAFPIRKSALSRWKYDRPRRYLAVSEYVAVILADAGIDSGRIDVVYDGVEVPSEPAHGDAVITPHTTDPAKGMALAEESAALAGITLVRSENLERDLPNARAMIYLSMAEGLGSGILLAMAHGVAVIASNVGGIPELIEDGLTGILVENDARSIAEAIDALNPELCREIWRNAREAVQNRFTVDHMVKATLASYRKALHD